MHYAVKILKDITSYGLEKIGIYASKYRGFVVDRDDPKGFGRLKVSVPEVYGDDYLDYWAWPASNYAGDNYGMQIIPKVNDLVWVEFEKGNPRRPLWNYGYFGEYAKLSEKPASLKDPDLIWFRSPSGITTLIDGETLKVYLAGKESIVESVALADRLGSKLENLIDALSEAKINTMLGPQPFLPDTILKLQELKTTLNEIKSSNFKVT